MHTVLIYIKKQCSIQRGLTVLLFVILSLGFEPKPSINALPRGGEHRAAECKWVACMCTGMYSEPAGLHETCTSWPTVHTSMSKKDTHKKHGLQSLFGWHNTTSSLLCRVCLWRSKALHKHNISSEVCRLEHHGVGLVLPYSTGILDITKEWKNANNIVHRDT